MNRQRFACLFAPSLLFSIACGEVPGTDPPVDAATAPDSAVADASDVDTPSDADVDALDLGPWGAPTQVAGLSAADVRGGSFTEDRLEVYFTSSVRPGGLGGFEIWKSTRSSTAEPWAAPTLVTELNTAAEDADPFVSRDGLTLWLASSRNTPGVANLFVSVRPSRSAAWGPPSPLASLNTAQSDEFGPSVSESGLILVFASNRNGNYDVFISTRASPSAAWGTPVAAVSSSSDEFGVLSADGLELFLTMSPDGNRDIHHAYRASIDGVFSTPEPVEELNSAGHDEGCWMSRDRRYAFFNRRDSSGYYVAMESVR